MTDVTDPHDAPSDGPTTPPIPASDLAEADSTAPVTESIAPAESIAPEVESHDPVVDPASFGEAAVDIARAAAVMAGGAQVGAYLGARAEPDGGAAGVVTHAFAADVPGYVGWHWAVSVVRAVGADQVTVDEVVLLPGDGALLAPQWVPWDQRVRRGDLSPGDLLPPHPDDPRLVPAYLLSDDPAVEAVGRELGLGRVRVLSREGRLLAADRWHDGDYGPHAAMARHAPSQCGTCGFYLPLAGSLQAAFGVCGNDIPDADGKVVSVEYGCGAHSQLVAEPTSRVEVAELVYDDGEEIVAEPAVD